MLVFRGVVTGSPTATTFEISLSWFTFKPPFFYYVRIYHHPKMGFTISERNVTWENRAPKDWQVLLSLGDVGFLLFSRVVSGDYGKPCKKVHDFQVPKTGLKLHVPQCLSAATASRFDVPILSGWNMSSHGISQCKWPPLPLKVFFFFFSI